MWHSIFHALTTTCSSDVEDESSYIFHLVSHRQWRRLHARICTAEGQSELGKCLNKFGKNPLHAACALQPPLYVVRRIAHTCPDLLRQVDDELQTPLHVAAERRSSPEVIEFLVRRHARAAYIRDVNGRTPLHLVAENFSSPSFLGAAEPSDDAVRVLCRDAPLCLPIEDLEGKTALECAILSKADAKVVHALQQATVKANKVMSTMAVQ